MAKPIKATPTLNAEASNQFIAEMLAVQKRKINKIEKEILKAILNY